MKLDLLSISIEGFKSFTTRTEISFEQFGPGLHFLRGINKDEPKLGSNGAGKTTLFDAICWCLHGKTAGGLRGPDVTPWSDKKTTTVVTVVLSVDGDHREITRTINPNSIKLDGKSVNQESIDSLLRMSFETFTSTALLGQGQPLFFDLGPSDKMSLFSTVLDLDRWDIRSKSASVKAQELDRKLSELSGERRQLENQEESLSEMLRNVKERSEEWESKRNARLKSLSTDLDDLKKRLEEVRALRDRADAEYDMAMTEIKHLGPSIEATRVLITSSKQTEKSLQKDLHSIDDKVCPTCGQPIKNHKVGKREELREQLELVTRLIACEEVRLRDLLASEKQLQDKAREAEASIRHHTPMASDLSAKITQIEQARDEKTEQDNPYRSQMTDLRRKLDRVRMSTRDLADRERETSEQFERTKFWIKGFKDIRLQILEDTLQELELATNFMLDEVGLVGWEVQYDIEKETKSGSVKRGLTVSILSPSNDRPVRWESWSGGEGQRLRLVGALALSDTLLNQAGVVPGFELLDEPTRHLSPQGVVDLCDILADRAQSLGRQIWFVDHMAIESSRFSSVLTVIKDGGGSMIG